MVRSDAGEKGLRLVPFTEVDFPELMAEVVDARFLLQWAGPEYTYPLDETQLGRTLLRSLGPAPSIYVYKAVSYDTEETVGHVQLMGVDRGEATCVLGRVLIFSAHRGRGLGREMVRLALAEAFVRLELDLVTLHVFAFNRAAIAVYASLGFSEYPGGPGIREIEGERWQVLRMGLSREAWHHVEAQNRKPTG